MVATCPDWQQVLLAARPCGKTRPRDLTQSLLLATRLLATRPSQQNGSSPKGARRDRRPAEQRCHALLRELLPSEEIQWQDELVHETAAGRGLQPPPRLLEFVPTEGVAEHRVWHIVCALRARPAPSSAAPDLSHAWRSEDKTRMHRRARRLVPWFCERARPMRAKRTVTKRCGKLETRAAHATRHSWLRTRVVPRSAT